VSHLANLKIRVKLQRPAITRSRFQYVGANRLRCDTPYALGLAALQSIGPLTGTGKDQANIAWTIYTGDLVSHDSQNQLSRSYVEYTETSKTPNPESNKNKINQN